MAVPTEQFIEIVSRKTKDRHAEDIDSVISWLRRRAQILQKIKRKDVAEIIKYCQYERVARDDIIVQQGEHADSMLIILRGSALAYMDTAVSGDEDAVLPSSTKLTTLNQTSTTGRRHRSKLADRTGLGKYIVRYGTGDHFGDVSLLNTDKLRNKTIVAEENCDLLIIGQKIFDKILKEVLQKEYDQVCHFLNNHPYFAHLSPRLKRMLELSLRKKSFSFDSVIVRQGAPVTALLFLLEGEANMYIDPQAYQKEFSKMWPFEASTDLFSLEFEYLRKARKQAILRKYQKLAAVPVKPDHLIVRRNDGYAAAEKMAQERSVCLCTIHGGEVLGDLEFVQSLGTYLSTVVSTVPTTAFVLEVRSLERLVGKRNPVTLEIMKQHAKERLEIRTSLYSGRDIAFLKYLLFKINEEDAAPTETSKLPEIKISKFLPGKDIQFQHLLTKFKDGQAQLIQPLVPGALIFKDQMQQKAKIRASVRLRGANVRGKLREVRQTIATRKPRSRLEIVRFLKESLESRVREYARMQRNKLPSISTCQDQDTQPAVVADLKENDDTKEMSNEANGAKSKEQIEPQLHRFQSIDNVENHERNKETIPQIFESGYDDTDHTHVRVVDERLLPSLDVLKNSPAEFHKEIKVFDATVFKEDIRVPTVSNGDIIDGAVSKGDIIDGTVAKGDIVDDTVSKGDIIDGILTKKDIEDNGPRKNVDVKSTNLNSDEIQTTANVCLENDNQEHGAFIPPSSHSKLPALDNLVVKDTEHFQKTKWEAAKRLVNNRINARFQEELLSHATSYEDFETSDNNLNTLENRIRNFFVNDMPGTEPQKSNVFVPKLRRFIAEQDDSRLFQPKPGAKVWVRKTRCCYANSSLKVTDHQHVRHHIVQELPEFKNVQKSRIVLHHMLPDKFTGNTSTSQY